MKSLVRVEEEEEVGEAALLVLERMSQTDYQQAADAAVRVDLIGRERQFFSTPFGS